MKRQSNVYNGLAKFIFLWATGMMPLYFENAYFNILNAKGHAFLAGTGIFLIAFLIITVIEKDISILKPRKNNIDLGLLVIAVTAVLSSLLSKDPIAAMTGSQGWWVGGIVFVALYLYYQVISKSADFSPNIWLLVILINSLIFTIGILHSMNVDVLGMHERILPQQYYWYISTIGNINWYSGYLCLLLPCFIAFYLESDDAVSEHIYLVFLMLGFVNAVLSGSDSIYLGIGVCTFFAIPYICSDFRKFEKTCLLMTLYGVAILATAMLPPFSQKRDSIHGISQMFLNRNVGLAVVAAGMTGMVLCRYFIQRKYVDEKRILKGVAILLEVVLGCVAAVFFCQAARSFGESFGTNRGRTWMYSMKMFLEFPWKEKLFGVGPELLGMYYKGLSTHFSRQILVAHSQPLQILMTMGIMGMIGWVMLWTGILKSYFENRMWQKSGIAFFLPLAAYLGQELVNTQMTTNIFLFCVLLSLYKFDDSKKERGKSEF